MNSKYLADYEHPLVKQKAMEISGDQPDRKKQIGKIFYYVRDEILFGFPPAGDLTKASETISLKLGQCNTKSTLFLALCKAAGIPARIHFSLIDKKIQKGLFSGFAFLMLPEFLSHSWIEVQIDKHWMKIDSFINDLEFYSSGKAALREKGWDTGYSISCSKNASSASLNLEQEEFVQMDAVVADHGVWDDPIEYYNTEFYKNRPNAVKLFLYAIIAPGINRKVAKMRRNCVTSICAKPQ